MGTADRECQSMHDSHAPAAAPVAATMPAQRAITPFGQLGRRKIQT